MSLQQHTSLSDLHYRVIQEKQLANMLGSELARQRESIDGSIRAMISDLRDFCLLDTVYPKVNESTVIQLLESSIFSRKKRTVYESHSLLPYPATITSKISNLLKKIYGSLHELAKSIDVFFNQAPVDFQFHPCSSPLSFFSASTLPSIFGYCWCVEQGSAYVNLLCNLISMQIQRSGSVNSSAFRNSYLREVIRQFIHFIGVQPYLQRSLSSFLNFLYDRSLDTISDDSPEYYNALISYVDCFTRGLLSSVQLIPPILRYFLGKAHETVKKSFGPESLEPTQLVSFIFFEIILLPALLNPKHFALIPETSVDPRSRHTPKLMHIFRWAADQSMITQKAIEMGILKMPSFAKLKVKALVEKLCECPSKIEGISAERIQTATGEKYHLILISINDIALLSKILQYPDLRTIPNLDFELVDFWFQSYKLPEQVQPIENQIYLPLAPSQKVDVPNDDLTKAAHHLIVYLEGVRPDYPKSCTLFEFLKARFESESLDSHSRAQAVLSKLEGKSEEEVLERLSLVLISKSHSDDFSLSLQQMLICEELTQARTAVQRNSEQMASIVNQSFIRLFVSKNKQIRDTIERSEGVLSTLPGSWSDFFSRMFGQLKVFAKASGLDDFMAIGRQFHSACMNMFAEGSFLKYNSKLLGDDAAVEANYGDVLATFSKDEYSVTLKGLFATPSCFESVIGLLRNGLSIGTPLEQLEKIVAIMGALEDIYCFEAGEGCPGDDILPLFIFALLQARLPNLASTLAKTEHFLISIEKESPQSLLDSKEKYVAATYVTAAEFIIGEAIGGKGK